MIPQLWKRCGLRVAGRFLNLTGRPNANSIDCSKALKNVHSLATGLWLQSWELEY